MTKNFYPVTITSIIKILSKDNGHAIFDQIIKSPDKTSDILRNTLKFTKKQFYEPILQLKDNGLVARNNGKYRVTSFGLIVNEVIKTLFSAAQEHYSTLK